MKVTLESLLGGQRNEVVEHLAWDGYRESAGLNPSTITQAVRGKTEDGELILSMRALKWSWEHQRKDTDDFLWGRAVHCLLFEPRDFEKRYVRWEDGRVRRGKDYEAFRLDNWGKDVLSASAYDSALEAAQAFVAKPLVQALIQEGQPEVTVFKVVDGIQCRGRLDWIRVPKLGRVIVDLKSTKSVAPKSFGYDFFRYHYDIKLGLYRSWFDQIVRPAQATPVTVIALEKEPPYEITVNPIPDAVLDYGAEKGRKIIKRVRQCIETGVWPGLDNDEEFYLYVPHAEMEDIELVGAEEVAA